jgi:hypothetical protein
MKMMTDGPHLAARQGEGGGVGRLLGWIGPKLGEEKGTFANFSKEYKQLNSNTGLNSANQKLCSSMNATVNPYSSFI